MPLISLYQLNGLPQTFTAYSGPGKALISFLRIAPTERDWDKKNLRRGKSPRSEQSEVAPPADFVDLPFYCSCVRMEDDISRYSRMRKLVVEFENINIE
jgi:hypothetical protein